ncbi:YIP1 family protein [Psychrobacillus soli]|uniref:Yip1 domain-containing protein n=1 Tax=Psychrobacillus soli TaxID=1543965 RepID=A0A544T4D7_9BACI|nr:YIP1 family protein [Psychrobacillus soli]TQR12315.1 hypothetical protein FG383_13660 [Psychrobacillus soli]
MVKKRASTQQAEANIHLENIKKKSKQYKIYFMQQLRNPSRAFEQGEKDFSNGMLSILLFAVVYTVSLFLVVNRNYFGESLGFFPFFVQIMFLTLLLFGIGVFALFIANNFFGSPHSLKAIISFYGGQLSPFLISIAISFLLIIIQTFTYGNIILMISFIFALFVLPLYLVSFLATKKTPGLDSLYGFILYIAVFVLLFLILVTILADTMLGTYLDRMVYLF